MSPLHDLTALEQAAAVRTGELSPVELVTHALERAEALSVTVGAFVTITPERALAAAAAAEDAAVAARRDGTVLPPLHGVPSAIKDLTLTAGVPTSFGTSAWAPLDLGIDEEVVRRFTAGGLISIGKTNTPEFGLPCYTEPDVAPPARTPWDLDRSAGGSSGGSAAAVAAGIVPVAHGNDGGGSIRIPASVTGLVGLKPSRGRVSNAPMSADISGLVCQGGLARTVADAAVMLDVLTGPAPSDPTWAPPLADGFLAALDEPIAGPLRIGAYRTPVIADADLDPACRAAWEQAITLLEDLGHVVVEHVPSWRPELVPAFETVWAAEALAIPLNDEDEARTRPLTRWLRGRGRSATGEQVWSAMAALRLAARAEIEVTQVFDAVLTPTLAQPPALVGGLRDDAHPERDFEAQKQFTPYTSPYNVSGQPAISLPVGTTDTGLPVGVQLVGRPYDEVTLLRLGLQLEGAVQWHRRRPPCW